MRSYIIYNAYHGKRYTYIYNISRIKIRTHNFVWIENIYVHMRYQCSHMIFWYVYTYSNPRYGLISKPYPSSCCASRISGTLFSSNCSCCVGEHLQKKRGVLIHMNLLAPCHLCCHSHGWATHSDVSFQTKQSECLVTLELTTHTYMMNFALRYGGNRTRAGANPHLIRSLTLTIRPTEYIRLVPNVPITCRAGSIPSVSQCKIHHKFSPLGDVSLRVCEHVGASLFVV